MNLSELKTKETAFISKVKGRGAFRKRIIEMGFVQGQKVTVIKNAPLKDPIEYRIMNYNISLRRSEARLIEVITQNDPTSVQPIPSNGIIIDKDFRNRSNQGQKTINIALVGNPNSGKTSLYNHASHSHEHVGNYGGVTIDSKRSLIKYKAYNLLLTDLPGTYSLTDYTPEELYVRKYIMGEMPDIVINVVDASNLERNLYLSTQLIDMDIRVIIALNMFDELEKSGDKFDHESLGKMMGIPFVPTVASKGKGIHDLFDKIIDVFEDRDESVRHIHINYGVEPERSIHSIQDAIWKNKTLTDKFSSRYYALKLLEKDRAAKFSLTRWDNFSEIESTANKEVERLESVLREDTETLITDARYGYISGALKETYTKNPILRRQNSEMIDELLTHKLFGFPVLLFILFLTFYSTFEIGKYPMYWLDQLVFLISSLLGNTLKPGPLTDLLVDGIIGGVGSVIIFLPNILILFFFISLMEDTGYMARAAFIMDKIMHKIGLHGRSFIPLVMGFGCNVPAIMASRTIKNRNNRLLTMLINPFMSCSARLPVYILIIGAFFPENPGVVLFSLYALGILIAALIAILFNKTIFQSEEVPFVMELPPYRIPTFRSTLIHMWSKGGQYLKKMGGVIFIASILIWGLSYYPRNNGNSGDKNPSQEMQVSMNNSGSPSDFETPDKKSSNDIAVHSLEYSYIGKIGHFMEPVMSPLGFDWKMSISVLTGIAAKEVVVSTMGVLYQGGEESQKQSETLIRNLKSERYTSGPRKGQTVFSPLVGLSYLVFILLYFPCIAVIVTIQKESGSWKWALFTMFYTTSLAWIMSFLVYQTGKFFNL